MAGRYGHLCAVLGETDSGKTCFLCAMYLLASCRELHPQYAFAGSRTLPGFEARLRLLRNWDREHLPERIADHTVLRDPRQPGLLHLLLREHPRQRAIGLFFTDLPGEWSQQLVEQASSGERLRFVRRADSIIVAFDSGRLQAKSTRHVQLQWGRLLLQRLIDTLAVDPSVPLVLLLTKGDIYGLEVPENASRLQEAAMSLGFIATYVAAVASFSTKPDEVASGTGISRVLDIILTPPTNESPAEDLPSETRLFSRFRAVQGLRE